MDHKEVGRMWDENAEVWTRIAWRDKDGDISRYNYDDENMVAEYDDGNNPVASYLQALQIDDIISMYRSGEMYWYHTDALGSVYQMTDDTEAIVRTYDYSAFGAIDSQTGALSNPFTYTAREYEIDSGLYYYRARYYDAGLGRFLSRDPLYATTSALPYVSSAISLRFEGNNLYRYVSNRPTMFIDSRGLEACHSALEQCIQRAENRFDAGMRLCESDGATILAHCTNVECAGLCTILREACIITCRLTLGNYYICVGIIANARYWDQIGCNGVYWDCLCRNNDPLCTAPLLPY